MSIADDVPENFIEIIRPPKNYDLITANGVKFVATPYRHLGNGLTVMACYDIISGNYFGLIVGAIYDWDAKYAWHRFKTFRPEEHKDLWRLNLEKLFTELDQITSSNFKCFSESITAV